MLKREFVTKFFILIGSSSDTPSDSFLSVCQPANFMQSQIFCLIFTFVDIQRFKQPACRDEISMLNIKRDWILSINLTSLSGSLFFNFVVQKEITATTPPKLITMMTIKINGFKELISLFGSSMYATSFSLFSLPASFLISRADSFIIPSRLLIVYFAIAGIEIVAQSLMRMTICMQLNNDQILLITSFPSSCPKMSPITTPKPVPFVRVLENQINNSYYLELNCVGISPEMIAFGSIAI